MIHRSRPDRRRGAVAVENALVLGVMFSLILGVIVLGMGVFRYQEMAYLAREGARWASVHGTPRPRQMVKVKNALMPMPGASAIG